MLPVSTTMVRVAFSKDYTLEPGFKSLHFQAPKTQLLHEKMAKIQQKSTVYVENHVSLCQINSTVYSGPQQDITEAAVNQT